jgi:hypothetical protein
VRDLLGTKTLIKAPIHSGCQAELRLVEGSLRPRSRCVVADYPPVAPARTPEVHTLALAVKDVEHILGQLAALHERIPAVAEKLRVADERLLLGVGLHFVTSQ